MASKEARLSRRALVRRSAGAVAATAAGATAPVTGQEDGAPEPAFEGFFEDVENYDGEVADRRGQAEASVAVGTEANGGNFGFGPPAIHVDPETTVVWEWTGGGGAHNVVHLDESFRSELTAAAGFTFTHEFTTDGIYRYYCQPHRGLGMKGAVVVGTDYPSNAGGAEADDGAAAAGDATADAEAGAEEEAVPPGERAPETAGNEVAFYTLLAMAGLGLLSPVIFAIVLRRRLRGR